MRHKNESREAGRKQAEDSSYYVRIAETLAASECIILVGHGTGASNAAHHLAAYLREHQRDIFARIAAELTADLSTLTDPQPLTLGAQALYARRADKSEVNMFFFEKKNQKTFTSSAAPLGVSRGKQAAGRTLQRPTPSPSSSHVLPAGP